MVERIGLARLAWIVVGAVLAAAVSACDATHSPSSPAAPIDFSGTWTGLYTLTGCDVGQPSPICSMQFKGGHTFPLQVTLTQQGAGVSGSVVFEPCATSDTACTRIPIPLSGGVDNLQELVLSGGDPAFVRITEWRTALSADGLEGEFSTLNVGIQSFTERETYAVILHRVGP